MSEAQVCREGKAWVIARSFRAIDGSGISGTRSRSAPRMRSVYDVWTGERWAIARAAGMTFPTEEEALAYLYDHWGEIHGLE